MRAIVSFFLLLFVSSSCTSDFFNQTLEVDPPAYEKQLVVHQLIADSDTALRVLLTRNHGILESVRESDWYVSGATVEWWVDGQKVRDLQPFPDTGYLYAAALPDGGWSPGKSYEMRVAHPDFPTIRAVQQMPQSPQVDSVRYSKNARNIGGNTYSSVEVYLHDPAGVNNYYAVSVEQLFYELNPVFDPQGNLVGFDTLGVFSSTINPSDSDDPNAEYGINRSLLVSDQFFDGQGYKMSFLFYDSDLPAEFRVHVKSVTEDYYLYALTAYRKYESENLPLVEPVTVHGNFENGIGIFALGAERTFILQ